MSSLKTQHPSQNDIHLLWEIFRQNVDPLTKIVHAPTLQQAIERAARNVEAVPRGFEALMFGIYSAAVMTLKDDECIERLGTPRKRLLSGYISATKAALHRAKFMGTTNPVVLQALVLHLLTVRDIMEPRAVWSLTGVAIRIAQGMGLDRDGDLLGLPPFETEIRRRIWWQLKTHDFRTAELCGIAKFHDLQISAESTKWPTNMDDDQLYPAMSSPATISNRSTDAIFLSVKCELFNCAARRIAHLRRLGRNSDPWDLYGSGNGTTHIGESSQEIEELLETKYLRYCDPSQPLHLMVMLLARCSINSLRFMSNHPRRWATLEEPRLPDRQGVWIICLKLLEQQEMLQSNQHLKRFAWYAPYFQQWHAIIHVLDSLCANPQISEADRAWKLIGTTFENNPNICFDTRRPIHIAVGNLCLKAYSTREAALQTCNVHPIPTPHFILQLRQHREAAMAKRLVSDIQLGQPYHPSQDNRTNVLNNDNVFIREKGGGGNRLNEVTSPIAPKSAGLTSEVSPINFEKDPLWHTCGFDTGDIDEVNDININLDVMFQQGESSEMQNISWDQWDSWLADSNMIEPL
jgi:hypothetical protein